MPLLDDDVSIGRLLRTSRTIAIVGLSDKPHRESFTIGRYLLSRGYVIYPVNPTIHSVLGLKSYPDLKDIAESIDIVDIFRRPDQVLPFVEEAIAIGARAIWFQLGVATPQASSIATEGGLQVVEHRCIMVEHRRLFL